MILTFIFSFNPESQEAAFAGNIGIEQALNILQGITIADAVRKAKEAEDKKKEDEQGRTEGSPEVHKE